MLKNGKLSPGATMELTITIVDDDGNLVDPDTVTFKTIDPNGAKATYVYTVDAEVTRSSEGVYVATFNPNVGGRWHFRWETTGGILVQEEDFIVQYSPFVNDGWPVGCDYA